MPALAIATSIAAEALHRARDRALERVEVGDVGLEEGGALAEPRRVLLEALGLESDERDVRAPRVQALGGAAPMPRAAPVMKTVFPLTSYGMRQDYPGRVAL